MASSPRAKMGPEDDRKAVASSWWRTVEAVVLTVAALGGCGCSKRMGWGGIVRGSRFYSPEASVYMERAKICGGFDSPNRREREEGGAKPEEEERKVEGDADRWVPHVGDSEGERPRAGLAGRGGWAWPKRKAKRGGEEKGDGPCVGGRPRRC
jgi:hypothetical protein